jgi:transposase
MTNLRLLNALLYVVEHGCKWRGLPSHFGNWHTIYTCMKRWSKAGVLDRIFARLQQEQILAIWIEHVCLDKDFGFDLGAEARLLASGRVLAVKNPRRSE